MKIRDPITVRQAAEIIGCTDGRVRQLYYADVLDGDEFNGRAIAISERSARKYAGIRQTSGRPRTGNRRQTAG